MPHKCSVDECKSNYDSQTEKVDTHGFPLDDPVGLERWVNAIPNILPSPITKHMAVCVKHWPPDYDTYKKKRRYVPVDPPSIFSVPSSYLRQTGLISPRNIESRKVDAESRRKSEELKLQETDIIQSWQTLKEFCARLDVDMVTKDDRVILSDISGDPPKLAFSLTIYENFSISCYKGATRFLITT